MSVTDHNNYERRITPIERLFTRSPFSTVTVVARITGNVSESILSGAISKVQQRHPHLRVRIAEDANGEPRFTSQSVGEIPVKVVPRASDSQWIGLVQEACQIPFEFEARPAIRFVLVQSERTSELIILCHHIICDGMSLAFLARDLMVHLGDPTREAEQLPDPVPVDRDSIPDEVRLNAFVRFIINRMNKKWENDKVVFDQEDYGDLCEAYWARYTHQILSLELSEAQTIALVHRSRKEKVTVNSALAAAFAGAQCVVLGEGRYHPSIGVGASLRNRLQRPVGEVMGFYAGLASLRFRYNGSSGFWQNARGFHRKVLPLYNNRILFKDPLIWCYLEPTILESINFKKIGGLVTEGSSRYEKISAFSARDDVVLSILKRDKMDSLDQLMMGTAVTNLGRLDLPRIYGDLQLDRLIMKPGGAFPLANVNLLLGAVTSAGKLSLVVEYVEDNIDTVTMEGIKEQALGFLLGE